MRLLTFFKLFFTLTILTFLLGCDEEYAPEEIINPDELLVVEGFIEMNDTTTFKLSKTMKLSEGALEKPVDDALVWIEDQNQNSYPLHPFGKGIYKSEKQNLNPSLQYRIHISLGHGLNYISDFVEPAIAPPIDSIYWESQPDGVQLFLDTHDPNNKSKYYLWSFMETWQYKVPLRSELIYDPTFPDWWGMRPRVHPHEDLPQICFNSASSTQIMLANSTRLSEDIIYKYPFYKIDLLTNRLQVKYSILVKQQILSPEAFQYWESLQKFSQSMGSLFDAQPNQLEGNIRSIDSDQKTIGYISAGSSSYKRMFVNSLDLPPYKLKTPFDACRIWRWDIVAVIHDDNTGVYLPMNYQLGPDISFSTRYCLDCRPTGQEKVPAFWQ